MLGPPVFIQSVRCHEEKLLHWPGALGTTDVQESAVSNTSEHEKLDLVLRDSQSMLINQLIMMRFQGDTQEMPRRYPGDPRCTSLP